MAIAPDHVVSTIYDRFVNDFEGFKLIGALEERLSFVRWIFTTFYGLEPSAEVLTMSQLGADRIAVLVRRDFGGMREAIAAAYGQAVADDCAWTHVARGTRSDHAAEVERARAQIEDEAAELSLDALDETEQLRGWYDNLERLGGLKRWVDRLSMSPKMEGLRATLM